MKLIKKTNPNIIVENDIIFMKVEIQEFLENQEIAWMKECVGIFFIAFSARKLRNQLIR